MKQPNSLRALASALVKACQADGAKGVKQSTLLNVLTKQLGYRSIQAAEQRAHTPTTLSAPVIHYLQGLLLQTYPDSDFFAIDFAACAGQIIDPKDIGEPLFAHLWNLLIEAPDQILLTLDVWKLMCNTATRTMLKKNVRGDSDEVQRLLLKLVDQHPSVNAALMLNAINAELKESCDQSEGAETPLNPSIDRAYTNQLKLIVRLSHDMRTTMTALKKDALAKENLQTPDTFLSETKEKDSWLR
jgi:hypothetical protein